MVAMSPWLNKFSSGSKMTSLGIENGLSKDDIRFRISTGKLSNVNTIVFFMFWSMGLDKLWYLNQIDGIRISFVWHL